MEIKFFPSKTYIVHEFWHICHYLIYRVTTFLPKLSTCYYFLLKKLISIFGFPLFSGYATCRHQIHGSTSFLFHWFLLPIERACCQNDGASSSHSCVCLSHFLWWTCLTTQVFSQFTLQFLGHWTPEQKSDSCVSFFLFHCYIGLYRKERPPVKHNQVTFLGNLCTVRFVREHTEFEIVPRR